MAKKYRPDIMLTDIKMDGMDGLELVEHTNQLFSDMVSIIICGYPDFAFAQRAIQLGVYNYLLKPVKSEELVQTLFRAVLQLQRARDPKELHTPLQKYGGYERWEKINAFVNGCFCQEPEELSELLTEGAVWFQLWNVRVTKGELLGRRQRESLLRGVCNIIQEVGDKEHPGCLLPIERAEVGSSVMVLAAALEPEEKAASQSFLQLAEKVRRQLKKNTGQCFFVSISEIRNKLSTSSVMEANRAMDVRFFYECACAPLLDYRKLSEKKSPVDFDHSLSLFKRALEDGNFSVALEAVSSLVNVFREAPVLGLRERYADVVRILSRFCYRKGSSILSFLGSENMNGSVLMVFETLDEVEENLRHIVTVAMQGGIYQKENTGDLLEQVREFVDGNFQKSSLSTAELARMFGISSGYLSTVFSKTYDLSISKYITQKRMEYAARLLKETTSSLETIAQMCGFNSFSYFMRVFKGYYGMTPARFRNEK